MSLDTFESKPFQLCLYPGRTLSARSTDEEAKQLRDISQMDLIHVSRIARAVEMMIAASRSMNSLRDTANNNANISKQIDTIRQFLQRRQCKRLVLLDRSVNQIAELLYQSENNLRLANRSVIERIMKHARMCSIGFLNEARTLSVMRSNELSRSRIECDDAFAHIVSLSRESFQNYVEETCRQLQTISEIELSDIMNVRERSVSANLGHLNENLCKNTDRIVSSVDAVKDMWDKEDMRQDDLVQKNKQLRREILVQRRLRESKRRILVRKRAEVSRKNTELVHDIIQAQNRYMRLVEKSQSFKKDSDDHYMRILTSDRAELVEMMATMWQSYISLTEKFESCECEGNLRSLYDEIIICSPSDPHMQPFDDIIELTAHVMDHVSRLHSELTERLQKLTSRKKIP